jgi:hypothetical protein
MKKNTLLLFSICLLKCNSTNYVHVPVNQYYIYNQQMPSNQIINNS